MGNDGAAQKDEKTAPIKEVWRGDIAANRPGHTGSRSLGEALLGNAMTAEEIAAVVKANPNYAGPILGAAAAKLGNTVATKAGELSETGDHSAHVIDRRAMAAGSDVSDTAKDQTAIDPGTGLFDAKGNWDGLKIASKLGQYDRIGGTDNDGQRCTFANLLTTKILAGSAATKAYLDSVYKRVAGGSIEIKDGRADAMGAAANSLHAIAAAIEAKTATYGDLSWAQESLYELFVDFVGSGTFSKNITNFIGEDQGYFNIGKELSGNSVPHDPRDNSGCIVDTAGIGDWTGDLQEGEAYVCAWIGPMGNPGAVSHQIMLVKQGGKAYIYDPEIHSDGLHMIPVKDSRVAKYFTGGNRIAVTYKMNAPAKPAADKDGKKKGATAAK